MPEAGASAPQSKSLYDDSLWRNDVFTAREAAQVLHVSTSTLYRMIAEGILVPSRTSRGVGKGALVIPRVEVENYIEALTTSARRLVDHA